MIDGDDMSSLDQPARGAPSREAFVEQEFMLAEICGPAMPRQRP
jgi:hypothetical protein